jgi:hypothetical protein
MDYHEDRFTDHSIIFEKKNKIVAVLPANENGKELISHAGLTFGGLVMHYDLWMSEVLEIFDLLYHYCADKGFNAIIYKVIPSVFHKYPSEEDLYALFRYEAKLIKRDISSVLSQSHKIRFSEGKRQAVEKCKRNDALRLAEATDFTEYWELLTAVLSKFQAKPVHSLEEIHHLKNHFPQQIKLYELRSDTKLLAGIVIYDYDGLVHTQYMANSQEGRTLGALDYLNDFLINEVYRDRNHYSWGISTEQGGRVLNTGLIQQKEGMGGRGVALDLYKIDIKI